MFIHRMLLEHFPKMELNSTNDKKSIGPGGFSSRKNIERTRNREGV